MVTICLKGAFVEIQLYFVVIKMAASGSEDIKDITGVFDLSIIKC